MRTLTAQASAQFIKQVSLRSVVAAFLVCVVFAVLGEMILRLFRVSVPAFQIGGGIIVLLFSIEMVMGGKEAVKERNIRAPEAVEDPSLDIAIYPLAVPLMASVSGLVAIVSILSQRDDLPSILFLTAVIAGLMGLNYVCLRACQVIVKAVGPAALQVVGKIMGVILTALAVELILMGLAGLGVPLAGGG